MSSQSDQYRRLFSGTLGLLPVVFSNRALGETLVHFLQECPYTISVLVPQVLQVVEVMLVVVAAAGPPHSGRADHR